MTQITVGKEKSRSSKKYPIYYSYIDVKFDKDGWAKSEDYLPDEYDMCELITEDGKKLKGWFTGGVWDGLKIKPEHKIKYWKRIKDHT